MSLVLYYHPLSSYCWKVLIALYENGTHFTPRLVDLADPVDRDAFAQLWPVAKFPFLHDEGRDLGMPESTTIIEYLALHYPGPSKLIPDDPDLARQARMRERVFDNYVMNPMVKIVTDRIRPAGQNDPYGVAEARSLLKTALDLTDRDMATKRWALGDEFTIADCAAAPALFYADKVASLSDSHPHASSYLRRLTERPSFARVLKEAEPYFAMFPG